MRILIGAIVFAVILAGAVVVLRMLASPPPREEEKPLEDVSDRTIVYRCSVCRFELRALVKPEGELRAPRHCGEAMELVEAVEE